MDPPAAQDPARRLWMAYEPIHAAVYFAPEAAEAARVAGLRGWWMGYFAGRFAPLGRIGPEPVTSMAFGFAPSMVARALPDAWALASPPEILGSRLAAVTAALRRCALLRSANPDLPALDRAAALLEQAAAACAFDGRPLAAAWAALGRPDDVVARCWLAATVLREHRGDGHVLAWVVEDVTGLEASLLHIGAGATTSAAIQPNRGWTDEQWVAAAADLVRRGLLDTSGVLTAAGYDLKERVERRTDHLAAAPVTALGPAIEELIELVTPWGRAIADSGLLPVPNPIGIGRP